MDKLRIKQRLIKFTSKAFDKFDLIKVLEYWISKTIYIKTANHEDLASLKESIIKKKNEPKGNTEEEDKKKNKEKEDKKKEKTDTNIKYEFKKPGKDIKKIIPHCNNLFYIIKSDN